MDNQWVVKFLDSLRHERRLSAHTVNSYRLDLSRFSEYCRQNKLNRWHVIDSCHIRQYVSSRHRVGLSGRSLQRELSAIRSFYKYLAKEEQVKVNPVIGVSTPKTRQKLPIPLDVDQMDQLLAIDSKDPLDLRDWAMMELMYSSGLRLAEVASLNRGDIDFHDAMVPVTGKGSKTRILPVGRLAIESVKAWLNARTKIANIDEPALFVSSRGGRLSHRAIQQRLARWGVKQGVDIRVHPHRIRHSFASHMLESSGDLRAVQELLGHADISTTQVYTHLDFQHLAKVYDAAHPRAKKK